METKAENSIDFSTYPVGTRVWDMSYGWGEIVNKRNSGVDPICASFESDFRDTYTIDGKRLHCSDFPCLFLNEFEIPVEAYKQPLPVPELEVVD